MRGQNGVLFQHVCNTSRFLVYWVLKGATHVQHCDEKLMSQCSAQQHRNDSTAQRKCTTGLFYRQNHNGEVVFRDWLCFSPAKGCVFCFHCRLMRSQLDAPPHVSSLVHGKYCDWKHTQERLRSHELSKEDINATIAFTARLNAAGIIDTALARQVEQEHQYWTSVLKRVISVMKFIAERGLAFRGSNELIGSPGNGNYLGLLELIAQYDSFLAQHISKHANHGRGHTNYLSSTIMEEIIGVIGKQVLGEIITRVKHSKYYCLTPFYTRWKPHRPTHLSASVHGGWRSCGTFCYVHGEQGPQSRGNVQRPDGVPSTAGSRHSKLSRTKLWQRVCDEWCI